jgi:hypothetical protein
MMRGHRGYLVKAQRSIFFSIVILFSVGCSKAQFSSSKEAALGKSVFTDDVNDGINQPDGSGDDTDGHVRQPSREEDMGQVRQPDGTPDEVDVILVCSDSRSAKSANFKRAAAQNLPVQLMIDGKACTSDLAKIKGLLTKKSITVADARAICPAAAPTDNIFSSVSLVIDGKEWNASMRGTLEVLYARNKQTQPEEEAADALCDQHSSPLVIHIGSDPNRPQPIALSSQADGVDFDLLGDSLGHESVRISWFTNHDYGLLALPDRHGKVKGIDQLFGNNTVGPDGLFSENGYAALAKYDGTTADGAFRLASADGVIDQRDAVYNRLRVWVDLNLDGVAQTRELIPLRRAGIASIDLDFSNDYAETDQYGNQTLMKSVVSRFDGTLDLIFDLWFAYKF